ncbi:MAG: RNHCP domain-containing protein [Nitrospirota bacterium]
MRKINESFTCKNCGEKNPKLEKSCRNHCRKCLYSLHVDKNTPGDRESSCKALMEPIKAEQTGKKGWMIYHKCTKCSKIIPNTVADDDNFEKVIEQSQQRLLPN